MSKKWYWYQVDVDLFKKRIWEHIDEERKNKNIIHSIESLFLGIKSTKATYYAIIRRWVVSKNILQKIADAWINIDFVD